MSTNDTKLVVGNNWKTINNSNTHHSHSACYTVLKIHQKMGQCNPLISYHSEMFFSRCKNGVLHFLKYANFMRIHQFYSALIIHYLFILIFATLPLQTMLRCILSDDDNAIAYLKRNYHFAMEKELAQKNVVFYTASLLPRIILF